MQFTRDGFVSDDSVWGARRYILYIIEGYAVPGALAGAYCCWLCLILFGPPNLLPPYLLRKRDGAPAAMDPPARNRPGFISDVPPTLPDDWSAQDGSECIDGVARRLKTAETAAAEHPAAGGCTWNRQPRTDRWRKRAARRSGKDGWGR